jgi:hypothetical protein
LHPDSSTIVHDDYRSYTETMEAGGERQHRSVAGQWQLWQLGVLHTFNDLHNLLSDMQRRSAAAAAAAAPTTTPTATAAAHFMPPLLLAGWPHDQQAPVRQDYVNIGKLLCLHPAAAARSYSSD